MLFLICNDIPFGVIIEPTRVALSRLGMHPAGGPSRGDLQHCAQCIN